MYIEGLDGYLSQFPHTGGFRVFPQHRVIWMKPAKNAGSSMRDVFKQFQIVDDQNASRWAKTIGRDNLIKFTIFVVLRDPVDRLASSLGYAHLTAQEVMDDPVKVMYYNGRWRTHSIPQNIYTHYRGELFVDHIFMFNRLKEDWPRIWELFHIDRPAPPLPHVNRSTHPDVMPPEDWIREYYAEDYRLLGEYFK